jgi:hypothetical protein
VARRTASNPIAANCLGPKFLNDDVGLAAAWTGSDNACSRWTHSSARLEHLPHMQGVPGSSPGASTKVSPINSNISMRPEGLSGSVSNCRGPICGPIEIQRSPCRVSKPASHIRRVVGSSPSAATIILLRKPVSFFTFLHARGKSRLGRSRF